VAWRAGRPYKPLPRPTRGVGESPLSARVRKLIGMLALLVFIVLYIGAMVRIGEALPDHWAARLVFYTLAGIGWGVPVLPLIAWMNRGR
jgi:hypothetical protein